MFKKYFAELQELHNVTKTILKSTYYISTAFENHTSHTGR